jgi:hypothetical protein
VKTELAGIMFYQESIKTSWDGVIQTITKDKSVTAIQRCMVSCKKSSKSAGTRPEKESQNNGVFKMICMEVALS